jgi:hypothetical protein
VTGKSHIYGGSKLFKILGYNELNRVAVVGRGYSRMAQGYLSVGKCLINYGLSLYWLWA